MQTPAPFEYARATSVDHAITLLDQLGPEARIIAGGHSLLPMMRLRLALPEHLIDIGELTDLAYIRVEGAELRIGAMTTHAALLDSAVAGEHFAILHDAERVVADPIVRNRGTVGGSLAQADPSEDLSAAFSAVGASVVARGPGGSERIIPVRDFHAGPYETALADNELLTEIRVPIRPGAGSAYEKVERRIGDWAIAAAGACVWLSGDGTISDVGIGLTAVGADRFCSPAAEDELRGATPTEEVLRAAAQTAAAGTNPVSDQRGPAEYKRHLAGELTFRALRRAVDRARGAS
ncbi:MAG: xanthine dehydrogenase family protein subunit M [Actinomycetota bacterium]|nr:xanthine dehydrogenase family protein subunit M [Actinomycetota bacterium]